MSGPAFKRFIARAFLQLLRKQMNEGMHRFKEAVEVSVTSTEAAVGV